MANYECTIRTNYFEVNDPEGFRAFMDKVIAEDNVSVWEREANGKTLFGFGCYGSIYGVCSEDPDEDELNDESYDNFIEGLQKFVTDNDAIIILEVGNEKMRYVVGSAAIITKDKIEYTDIETLALEKVQKVLGNPDYHTVIEY